MLYLCLQWLQYLTFLNHQGQHSQPQDFFDEKNQERGGGLHSSLSYTTTGAYIPFPVKENQSGLRAQNLFSQARTSLLQLVHMGVNLSTG